MDGKRHDRRPEKWLSYPVAGRPQANRLQRLRWVRMQLWQLQREFDTIQASIVTAMSPESDRMVWIDLRGDPYLVVLTRDDPVVALDEKLARQHLTPQQLGQITETFTRLDTQRARELVQKGEIDPETASEIFRMTIPEAKLQVFPDWER